jgi:predicted amidophosphoribosyltransferase
MYGLAIWVWFSSAVAAGIIGHARQAAVAGAVLGIFLGPIGVLAAFALDGRPSCPHCAGKLDGRGQFCQHCHKPIRWHDSPSESSILPLGWLKLGGESLSCPHCGTGLDEKVARCPKCTGSITWAKGLPLKVSRHDSPEVPAAPPAGKPWSQIRGMR